MVGLVTIPTFLYFFTRYVNTSRAGGSIKADVINYNANWENEGNRVDIAQNIIKIFESANFDFDKTFLQNLKYRGQANLQKVKNARDLVGEKLESYLNHLKENKARDYSKLIVKLENAQVNIKDFKGVVKSNIKVLEDAMTGVKYNVLIKDKINSLRDANVDYKNIDDILSSRSPFSDVKTWGEQTLTKLEKIPTSEITINDNPLLQQVKENDSGKVQQRQNEVEEIKSVSSLESIDLNSLNSIFTQEERTESEQTFLTALNELFQSFIP